MFYCFNFYFAYQVSIDCLSFALTVLVLSDWSWTATINDLVPFFSLPSTVSQVLCLSLKMAMHRLVYPPFLFFFLCSFLISNISSLARWLFRVIKLATLMGFFVNSLCGIKSLNTHFNSFLKKWNTRSGIPEALFWVLSSSYFWCHLLQYNCSSLICSSYFCSLIVQLFPSSLFLLWGQHVHSKTYANVLTKLSNCLCNRLWSSFSSFSYDTKSCNI